MDARIERRVRHLRHPGQVSTIAGPDGRVRRVKREAFRFVVDGTFAYSVEDAVALIAGDKD